MNRNAIAMAADSAVTIGNHLAIHNSANKLFSLSFDAPLGVIVYSNPVLMAVPMEIIIKEYRKNKKGKTCSKFNDYVHDFMSYMEKHQSFFRFDVAEREYVCTLFLSMLNYISKEFEERLHSGSVAQDINQINTEKIVFEMTLKQSLNFFANFERCNDFHFSQYVEGKYRNDFMEIISKSSFADFLTFEDKENLVKIGSALFDTIYDGGIHVGLAIAGYGESEIFPSLIHLHIGGVINGKIRYWKKAMEQISEKKLFSIVPFAQTDVIQTFMFGINDRFLGYLSQEVSKQIQICVDGMDNAWFMDGKKSEVCNKLCDVSENILKGTANMAFQNYLEPIRGAIETLPIEELSLLAESMINITSIRRKVALDSNVGTVGGPIDVAIISKGDGFIWMKRKHYFDKEYNPQYFYSHYKK